MDFFLLIKINYFCTMKIISTYLAGIKTQFKVYDSVEEFENSNELLQSLANAEPGNYVLTDNGYYVPVLRRNVFKAKTSKHHMLKITTPRQSHIFTYDEENNKLIGKYNFVYTFDIQRLKFKKLNSRAKMFGKLLLEGTDMIKAYTLCYANTKSTRLAKNLDSVISALINNDLFFDYLREIGLMDKTHDKLKEHGITTDYFLGKIKEVIDDKDENASLRKFALSTVMNMLNQADDEKRIGAETTPEKLDLKKEVRQITQTAMIKD